MGLSAGQIVIIFLVFGLVVALIGWWRAVGRVGRENRVRQIRATAGEGAADAVLAAHGYRVVDAQVTVRFVIRLDDDDVWVHNRCDRVVERDGRIYVADIKTGARATDPTHPATRRQLLEYWLAHDADGVLLVDMDAGTVIEVAFPSFDRRQG